MARDEDLGDPVPLDPAGVVVSDPGIAGGEPIFRGTRVPLSTLFDYIEDGYGLHHILAYFPTLDHDDVVTVLREAQSMVAGRRPRGDATPNDTERAAAE